MIKNFKKTLLRTGSVAAGMLLAVCLAVPVMATPENPDNTFSGTVTFNAAGNKLENEFTDGQFQATFSDMLPGDDAKVTLTLTNANAKAVNWYMDNDILSSLEDNSSASGGAYTYSLSYKGPGENARELFNSDTVGGEDSIGLDEINNSFMSNYDTSNVNRSGERFFALGNIGSGKSGTLTLYIKLDGETQNNDYQNTLAQMAMKFAVEITDSGTSTTTNTNKVVKTGDDSKNLFYMILAASAGVVLLFLALAGMKMRKQEAAEAVSPEQRIRNRREGRK